MESKGGSESGRKVSLVSTFSSKELASMFMIGFSFYSFILGEDEE